MLYIIYMLIIFTTYMKFTFHILENSYLFILKASPKILKYEIWMKSEAACTPTQRGLLHSGRIFGFQDVVRENPGNWHVDRELKGLK